MKWVEYGVDGVMNGNDEKRVGRWYLVPTEMQGKHQIQFKCTNGGKWGSPNLHTVSIPSIAQPPNAEGDYPSRDSGD